MNGLLGRFRLRGGKKKSKEATFCICISKVRVRMFVEYAPGTSGKFRLLSGAICFASVLDHFIKKSAMNLVSKPCALSFVTWQLKNNEKFHHSLDVDRDENEDACAVSWWRAPPLPAGCWVCCASHRCHDSEAWHPAPSGLPKTGPC